MLENFTNFDGTSRKAGPSSKLQLKNAAHTLATLEIFAKSVTPFALSFRLHNYEQVPIVQCKATADRYISILFVNISRFACVCAFFLVLRGHLILEAALKKCSLWQ